MRTVFLNITALAIFAFGSTGWSAERIDFAHEVVPILKKHCVECHGGKKANGGFSINTRHSVLDEGYVIPGDVENSYLLDLVASDDADTQMPPPEKPRLSDSEVASLRKWIESDVPWEESFTFAERVYEPPLHPRHVVLPPPQNGRHNPIDRILDQYLLARNQPIPEGIDDRQFVRRVYLDLIGILPTPAEVEDFVNAPHSDASQSDNRTELVDQLLSRKIDYADHWMTFWNDLLRNDYTGTGFITGGRKQISGWLYQALVENLPFDQFTRELISPESDVSRGFIDGIKWRGEVSAGQTLEIQFAQSISQAFLGINMKCASCHDSFVDHWKLEDAYGLAAIYATDELMIHRCDKPIDKLAKAAWVFPELGEIDPQASRDERLRQLASLMTDPQNGRFSRTIVNRLWAQLMGRGIVHPLDAMQTEPWSEDLLDFLAEYLVETDYDLKKLLRLIATSKAYQSKTEVLKQEADSAEYIYAGPRARRMTAEQFLDGVWAITETAPIDIDAPVLRSNGTVSEETPLEAKWIWRSSKDGETGPPGPETIVLRKILDLDQEVQDGAATMTCDNEFSLYLNGREVVSGDAWNKPVTIPIHHLLKVGKNNFSVVTTNSGDGPNPAGFIFEARFNFKDGSTLAISSDDSWHWSENQPSGREGRLGQVKGPWHNVVIVPTLQAWEQEVGAKLRQEVGRIERFEVLPARASLLNNDAMMQALGRPMREQIVSSRPSELTTLEAIHLTNHPDLAKTLSDGAGKLCAEFDGEVDSLVEEIYLRAFGRVPTDSEKSVIVETLQVPYSQEDVEDLLWAVVLTPEFFLIR
ncbi:Planctomycete cytochrome C [Thalassoglobus neptunius]|uniref:Planctomycete cytochrome C n=1 Tax=Thalassoglobus neptunius TaxID=1938619 RepID=A0A5C5X6X1_9PLAN|nr:DUF1549 domain-containing protein [Thalassoglobus neptunius]TWT57895.1 Planctomycete cytochrome C [Thalassoglobus neptunius]